MATTDQAQANRLRQVQRVITTRDDAGKSTFLNSMPTTPPWRSSHGGAQVAFSYSTDRFPPNLSNEADVVVYEKLTANPPTAMMPNACFAHIADFPPDYEGPMHQTETLNFNVVIEGEVDLVLDSGQTRRLLPGDTVVQRAGNHAWRNTSSSQWARIVGFAIPAVFEQGSTSKEQ